MRSIISNNAVIKRMFSMVLALCFMLALLPAVAPPAQAADDYDLEVYVDQETGDDLTGDDTGAPFKTIGAAVAYVEEQTYTAAAVYISGDTYSEHLTIHESMSLVGASMDTTIIDGTGSGRCVTIEGSDSVVTIQSLTIQNGKAPNGAVGASGTEYGTKGDDGGDGDDGGGVYCSGTLTLTGCTFTSNTAGNGGAGGSGNGGGGAGGNGGDGGGVYCSGTLTLTGCTFASNTAGKGGRGGAAPGAGGNGGDGGDGGGVYCAGEFNAVGCNIADNKAGDGGSGYYMTDDSGADGTYSQLYGASGSANNNWWGANSVPSSEDTNLTPTNYLVLTISAADDTVTSGLTTQVTASLTKNNVGETVSGLFSGGTVSFDAANGSFDTAVAQISAGIAVNTFTAGAAGTDTITATLDNRSVTVDVTVIEIGISQSSLSLILNKYQETALTPVNTQGTLSWSAAGLPAGLDIDADTGVVSGTPSATGDYPVQVTLEDDRGETTATAVKTVTVHVYNATGNGAYLVTPVSDAAYTAGIADGLIPTMTVSVGASGFTYFAADISAVLGHSGEETAVFVHLRDGTQLGMSFVKADFENVSHIGAGFNVKAGDVVKVYIVDGLTNGASENPEVL